VMGSRVPWLKTVGSRQGRCRPMRELGLHRYPFFLVAELVPLQQSTS
jgi:hypothetical protein